jgi:hypothetical protein
MDAKLDLSKVTAGAQGSVNKLQKRHSGKLSEIALLPNADVMRYL